MLKDLKIAKEIKRLEAKSYEVGIKFNKEEMLSYAKELKNLFPDWEIEKKDTEDAKAMIFKKILRDPHNSTYGYIVIRATAGKYLYNDEWYSDSFFSIQRIKNDMLCDEAKEKAEMISYDFAQLI